MNFVQWKTIYETGISRIDNQHKQLVSILNQLFTALTLNQTKSQMEDILSKLADYTITHFATEESYMSLYKYPDYKKHKEEHQLFVKKVKDFQLKFKSGETSLSAEILRFLRDWIAKHIVGSDKAYVPFLKSKGVN